MIDAILVAVLVIFIMVCLGCILGWVYGHFFSKRLMKPEQTSDVNGSRIERV